MLFHLGTVLLQLLLNSGCSAESPDYAIRLATKRDLNSRLANIHLTYNRDVNESHFFTYRPCQSSSPADAYCDVAHHTSGRAAKRIAWVIPDPVESGLCLSAWSGDNRLLGRSEPLSFTPQKQARDLGWSIPMSPENGFDVNGPWFNGVEALKQRPDDVDAEAMKRKKIAIVGAGTSGLMTYLNLKTAGFKNVEIIEASQRLGGRVKTEYFDTSRPWQYQELGAMRFPESVTNSKTNETFPVNDQKMVFQLAETLNRLNNNSSKYKIEFIPFVQYNPNALYYFDGIRKDNGQVPTVHEAATNSSLKLTFPPDPAVEVGETIVDQILRDPANLENMMVRMFEAHKDWIEKGLGGLGGDDWSEFAFMHDYLRLNLNVTDQLGALAGHSSWVKLYEAILFGVGDFAANWLTIEGGASRLPEAFDPIIGTDIKMGREITKLDFLSEGDGKVKLSWKENNIDGDYQSETYDYAVIAVPFSVVRRWRIPRFSLTLASAIKELVYQNACKIALQYKTRFWEKRGQPIYGGANTQSDIPGIGNVVYPSYGVNDTGPGVILGTYDIGQSVEPFLSIPEEEYVQDVADAMVEIHGEEAREQYTGNYSYQCWVLDRYGAGAWADPAIGQHKLYIPSYFKTEKNVIFVGEHTTYTHAWVASALESAVRGSAQLFLELGLVDEAKDVVREWMARWIKL